ncbi:ATP-binding cassette sub-family A member 5 [Coniochaeta hoffmannii]|uniref:ATP-binding cassette sub-family A member 5 n=1 Tax=Coniochaeta hoffmannii TaxID=91930 RepID=A0AA38S667_9PEZI|nr:ATP-binding cassette sub-family A member 5 [Coniochaeta hoffmannii]
MRFFRQTWTLTSKTFLIVLQRHWFATFIRAFILPLALTAFLSFARNLFVPAAVYGFGSPSPVLSLHDALEHASGSGRQTVAFVNNGFVGGDIERVIDTLTPIITDAGARAQVLTSDSDLLTVCRASLRGVTPCYGAVVFNGSPDEGAGGLWNYTIRSDGSLGVGKIDVDKTTNDAQVYMFPLQHAIDAAIASVNSSPSSNAIPDTVEQFPFTGLTPKERADRVRVLYQKAIMNFLGVTFIAGMIGVVYHMTGFIASERETGMSTLIEAMMPTSRPWHAQAARLLSYHVSFTVVYAPGWIIGSIILGRGVFAHTNLGVVLIYHILAGLALSSMSIFGAAFFRKSQLSGVCVTIAYILLAIIAQTLTRPKTAPVVVLSLLFAPCNYTFFISLLARWEQQELATNLVKVAPNSPWSIPGIVLWIFLVIQIVVYPILGALLERYFHGTSTNTRNIIFGAQSQEGAGAESAVRLEGFTKIYSAGIFRRMFSFISKPKPPVVAVDGLTLSAGRGQILALLGANGSGKSTTLDSIAGTTKLTSGNITIDGTGGLGIAPQKNVLWDELSVEEHLRIFNRLKSPGNHASKEEIRELIHAIDLDLKVKAHSKTLSGGQKRKLQLGMMLTGGSAVCCVDEVSSGIDPLSRRKIWDILLAERGRRTIIMTTHFLDEADILADRIAILSKGTLRAEGSSVELKDRLGGGYRIHVHNIKDPSVTPDVPDVKKTVAFDLITYIAPTSGLAAQVIRSLESSGISEYGFSGPTIEDVFLQLAEEARSDHDDHLDHSSITAHNSNEKHASSDHSIAVDEQGKEGLELLSGQKIGYFRQACVLYLKRCTIFKTNWFPYVAAFVIPVAAAGLVTLFVKGRSLPGCTPTERVEAATADVNVFSNEFDLFVVGGPASKFNEQALFRLFAPIYLNTMGNTSSGSNGGSSPTSLFQNLTLVNTLDEFNNQMLNFRKNVTPAGLWLGDANSPPTVAYKGSGAEMINAWFGGWVLDMLLSNISISSTYVNFDIPWAPDTGNSLQLIVYVGLALAAYPGFFALYPNVERRRNVRGLQYSNGVRTLPLWLAYVVFDFSIVIVSSALAVILFAALSSVWWNVAYLFLIFMLYGLTSILLAYVISLFASNQLSAYAFTAAGQAVLFLVYLIAYLCTITYAPVNRIDQQLILVHFVVSAFAPIGSVIRSMFLALNLFSTTCVDDHIASNPGGILQYGGPILYLVIQCIVLFILLLWLDSGDVGSTFKRLLRRDRSNITPQDPEASDEEISNELARVTSTATADGTPAAASTDGLRVVHLTKTFGKNTAVDNVTFGVKHGEVFALLGPNGAGKSTTISMIRGDLKPDRGGGDVFVESVSVTKHLAAARSNLGVCPQFDAVDQMTVQEHLRFYARVRGIPDVEHNVEAVVRAVGLQAFRTRQAFALSGGNKRKLSLGIALMGNPTVVLLDEPSSGLDAAAKRVMWRTLAAAVPGRSILLTTHSMEEADALAGRAGILAKRMLAMGTTEGLRHRFGDALHVHVVCKGAPRTSDEDVAVVRAWVRRELPDAAVEEKTYHGQMRFSIPARAVVRRRTGRSVGVAEKGEKDVIETVDEVKSGGASSESAIGQLVVLLEENKEALGVEHFSVSPTTLDQVFLAVVGRHGVQEEGYEVKEKKAGKWWRFGK